MNGDSSKATMSELEIEIAERRQSLDRKLDEIGRRLHPRELTSELTGAVKERLDPEPYLPYIAGGLVAMGTFMAVRGFTRGRRQTVEFPSSAYVEDPGDSLMRLDVFDCS
jgi:hypothetical protein